MLDKAAEAGINFIDTADLYPPGAEVGGAEIIAGRWLSNKRAGFILATKGGGKMGPAAWDAGSSRKHLLDAIDASLGRLNTDYVDLYQLHFDDSVTPIDEMVGAMDTIVRSQEEGLAVIPFNPLAGGLLSDTPEKGRFSAELGGFGQAYHARYWHEREFEKL